uniref:Uncharacterized protein n=1 Tax=Setaria italica TaxID=4555 RepID=K3XRH9_SETIT
MERGDEEVDFRLPCPGGWTFCSICREAVCLRCCPDHGVADHGVGPRRTMDLAAVKSGKNRDIVHQLVNCDYTRRHFPDRFCTGCELAFSSWFCEEHHHHHDAADDFQVFDIVRKDGWLLIHDHQLPGDLTDGIKTVEMEDGNLGVPLRPRLFPNPSGGSKLCDRHEPHNCMEAVEQEVCSIYCKIIVAE